MVMVRKDAAYAKAGSRREGWVRGGEGLEVVSLESTFMPRMCIELADV